MRLLNGIRARAIERRIWTTLQRLKDPEARLHAWLMADTIAAYARLFNALLCEGIDSVIEIGPGRTSLPALANATLPIPLTYCAIDPSAAACRDLKDYCESLGLGSIVLNRRYDARLLEQANTCLLFEHSVEDLFIESFGPPIPKSPKTSVDASTQPRFIDIQNLNDFVLALLESVAESHISAAVFHHFSHPAISSDSRDILDPAVVNILNGEQVFRANLDWIPIHVEYEKRLASETWVAYRRTTT